LRGVIETEISRFKNKTALEQEREAQGKFAGERARLFAGRAALLQQIAEYLAESDARPLVVHGPSGSGKSAILGRVSEVFPGIRRFVGVTAEASNGLSLLRSLCEEIGERYGRTEKLPDTFEGLAVVFQDRIRLASAGVPLILYIDGVDQLDGRDPAVSLAWLPDKLPPHCRVVVSTIAAPAAMGAALSVAVAPFTKEEAGEALDLWLEDAGRTLREDQRQKVLGSAELPLDLRLAFDEACLWRSFDPIERCVLGDGGSRIIGQLIARLSAPDNHGDVVVSHALGFLTASRYGLTEGEILSLLSRNDSVWRDFEKTRKHEPGGLQSRLPTVIWSRLFFDLEPYLSERAVPGGTVLTFYHRRIAEWIGQHPEILGVSNRDEVRNGLVAYFSGAEASPERQLAVVYKIDGIGSEAVPHRYG